MSSVESSPVQPEVEADSAAVLLRQARERRGESLEEVAQALKLSMRQIEAIENGRYEALPGPAFVRGFVRNYARHLGLDADAVLAVVGEGASGAVDLTPLSNAEGDMPANRGVRFNLVPAAVVAALLLALISAGGYLGWFETPPTPDTEAVVPGLPPDAATLAAPADVTTPPDTQAALPPGGEPVVGQVAVVPESVALPAPVAAEPPSAPVAAVTTVPEAAPAVEAKATAQPAAVETAAPLRFVFSADAWVEVKDDAGGILFSGVGSAGSTRTVQGKPPFSLVIGNARSVRLEFNGNPVDLAPHTKVSVARLTVK